MTWGCGFAFNCDRCGRFTNPDAPGVSWSRVWFQDGYGGELQDPEFRCSPCTDKHGVGFTNCAPGYPGNGRTPRIREMVAPQQTSVSGAVSGAQTGAEKPTP